MARKQSAQSQARARRSGSVSDSDGNETEPSLSYPLTFVLTPVEAFRLQSALSKVGLTSRPSGSLPASLTAPATPTPSYPSTPVSGLPPGKSPFAPFSSISDATEQSPFEPTPKPSLRLALRNAFHDEVLPLSSRTALRAFAAGWLANYSFRAALPALMLHQTPRDALVSLTSLSHQRIGLALALFSFHYRNSSYVLTLFRNKVLAALPSLAPSSLPTAPTRARILARLVRLLSGNGVVPFIAALLSSPAFLLLPRQVAGKPGAYTFPRKSFALDLFSKGFQANYNLLRRRQSRVVSWVPDWFDSALLYAIGNGQLLWAFLFEPDCFPKGYGDIILARSSAYVPSRPADLPSAVPWPSRREIADHVALLSTPKKESPPFPDFISPSLSALHPSPYPTTPYHSINPILDYSPAHPAHTELLCALLHPTEPSCRRNFLQFWAKEWKGSARFVSFFLAIVNLLKWKSWKKDPEGALFRFAMGVVQGATVISGSIGSAWALTCLFQHYLPRRLFPRTRYFLNGFLSSIFIFAVPAARRAQLGLYVARLSADSSWQIFKKQGKVKSLWNGDVLILAVGLAMLTSIREDVPSALGGYARAVTGLLTGPRMSDTASGKAGLPLENKQPKPSEWVAASSVQDFGLSFKSKSK